MDSGAVDDGGKVVQSSGSTEGAMTSEAGVTNRTEPMAEEVQEHDGEDQDMVEGEEVEVQKSESRKRKREMSTTQDSTGECMMCDWVSW